MYSVCEAFYISVMPKEIESSNTFMKCNVRPNTILSDIGKCTRKPPEIVVIILSVRINCVTPVSF